MSGSDLAPEDAAWITQIRGGADTNTELEADADGDEPDDAHNDAEGQSLSDDGWPTSTAPDPSGDQRLIDLDAHPDDEQPAGGAPDDDGGRRRRFNPMVAAGFGGAAVLATIVTLAASTLASRDEPAPPPAPSVVARPPQLPAPPAAPPAAVDKPLRFTATSECDQLPGSTPAQMVADPQSTVPWICASEVPGQVLNIYLDKPYVITAVSIVPGAVNKTSPSGDGDPWLRHRVVTRLQWQFNDRSNTIKPQNTGSVHGEAVESIPSALASMITVIIQETHRPPKVAPTTTTAPPVPSGDGILGPILGGNGQPQDQLDEPPLLPGEANRPDPSDGTFAVSNIKIIGHEVI
jgi:hypothetical protein